MMTLSPYKTGGYTAQGGSPGRDRPGVLLVRQPKRLPAGLYPRQGGLCGGAAVQAALRRTDLAQGHELGTRKLEATH